MLADSRRFAWYPSCCEKSQGQASMDASLGRDTVTARGVSERFDDAWVNLPANSKPPVQKRVDSLVWGVYRDALATVVIWLVLVGLAFFALSTVATRVRPTVAPLGRLPEFVTPGVSEPMEPPAAMVRRRVRPIVRATPEKLRHRSAEDVLRAPPPGNSRNSVSTGRRAVHPDRARRSTFCASHP